VVPKILKWIKDLPQTIKVVIALIGTTLPIIILIRANYQLGVITFSAAAIAAVLSFLAHISLAVNKSAAGFSSKDLGKYRYPRYRRWAVAGIIAIVLGCGFTLILKPTRYYILAALKGTTVPPRADVLIAEFDSRHASKKFEIPNRLRADLEKELQRYDIDIKVEILSRPIASLQEAKEIADQAGSKMVVWGWYDDFGVTVNILTPMPRSGDNEPLRFKELPWTQGANALEDISFKIREQLPDNITFLSLFVIGNLYYLNNEYQKGHQAFDATMHNLPKESRFENESLLHFFSARSLEAGGLQNAEGAICAYVKAIELNPHLAAAYNNLGVVLAKLHLSSKGQQNYPDEDEVGGLNISEGIKACMSRVGLAAHPSLMFDEALKVQPDSAIIQYNDLVMKWSEGLSFDSTQDLEVVRKLESIIRKDPSIPGAHVMRGVLAFKDKDEDFDDWQSEVALREFSAATQLLPNSAELHVNIGKVHLRKGRHDEARESFDKALNLAPGNIEARLALADMHIRQGQPEVALRHLQAVRSDRYEDAPALGAAAALEARLHFESGDTAIAVETLLNYLSHHSELMKSKADIPQDKFTLMDDDTSLIHYILGLLYASASDAASATRHWNECDVPELGSEGNNWLQGERRISAHNDNDTTLISWLDLLALCNGHHPSKWGGTVTCLPHDARQRLAKVFDITQNRVAHRIFYRVPRENFYGLACPYVYTFDQGSNRWLFETTIIHKLDRMDLETVQSRTLKRFDGRLIVREVEPEISHLDRILVVVTDRLGQSHVLRPQLKSLQNSDGQYLVLHRRDEVMLIFEGFDRIDRPVGSRVEAEGYYTPLK
jgi:tetratricopeptide (TPR) repeat protein